MVSRMHSSIRTSWLAMHHTAAIATIASAAGLTTLWVVAQDTTGTPPKARLTSQPSKLPGSSLPNASAPLSPAIQSPAIQSPTPPFASPRDGWYTFERCPVFAMQWVEVPAQESGVIQELLVQKNDYVEAKQILGRQDTTIADLEKSVSGLQAQVAASEALDTSDVRLAQSILEEMKLQESNYTEMHQKNTASDSDLKQRQLATEQARVKLTQTEAAAKQRELRAKLAQSALFLNQRKVDRLIFTATIPGIVTEIDHHAGEWVPAGKRIFKIVRMDELLVDCFVDINRIDPALLLEQPVKITLNQRGNTERLFVGRITSFDPDVSATGTVRVHAAVQNQRNGDQWTLLPGMSVSMQLRPLQ